MNSLALSPKGEQKIEVREGRKLEAYLDIRGIPTIGVGHTGYVDGVAVHLGMTITSEKCDELFMADVKWAVDAVNKLVKAPLEQNQFDALVSFVFNIGAQGFAGSTCLRLLNQGAYTAAANAMLNWEKPASLKGRREGERAQFLEPYTEVAPKPQTTTVPQAAAPKVDKMTPSIVVTPQEKSNVNVLAGLENIFGNVVSSIESSVIAATSSAISTVSSGSTSKVSDGGIILGSISDAQRAVADIETIIADIRTGKIGDTVEEVFDLLKTVMAILARFGVNIPVVSAIIAALPAAAGATE